MRISLRKQLSSLLLILVVGFSACRKGNDLPSWDVDLIAPVVYAELGIGNLLPDSLLQVNADSSVTLVFDNTVYELSIDSLVDIPDTTINFTYTTPPISVSVPPGGQIYSGPEEHDYSIDDVELLEMEVRSGMVEIVMSSNVPEALQVTYTITSSGYGSLGGAPLSLTTIVPPSNGSTVTVTEIVDLSGYWFDLRGSSFNSFNKMNTEVTVLNALTSDTLVISGGLTVNVDNSFLHVIPQYARGYFGARQISIPTTLTSFDAFNSITGGTLDVDDVDVVLEINNGIGVDAQVRVNELSASNTNSATSVNLNHNIIGNNINLSRAIDVNGWVDVEQYTVDLNTSNSNIDQFFELLPNEIGYAVDLDLNPFGNVSNGNDFMYYNKGFTTNLNAQVPLCLIANDLTLVDTIEVNVHDSTYQGHVNSATFTVYADNGFPLEAEMQLYLLDHQLNIVDSIVVDQLIAAALVDGQNLVTDRTASILTINLPSELAEHVHNHPNMVLHVKFNTNDPANGHTKIYDYHTIALKLVADFNYTVDLNNNDE